jgi:hypothetical protein
VLDALLDEVRQLRAGDDDAVERLVDRVLDYASVATGTKLTSAMPT